MSKQHKSPTETLNIPLAFTQFQKRKKLLTILY